MGVYYTVFVIPEATSMDFSPDGRVLSELAELLCRLKWGRELEDSRVNVGDDAGGIEAVPVHGQARADAFDSWIAQRRGFSFRLAEVPDDVFWPDGERREDGLSRKYDFSDDPAGMFRPEHCDGATLIWSPFLVSVPQDSYSGTPAPCGACRADVLEDLDFSTPEARGLHFAGITQRVPERCRSCGISLEPRSLIAEMRSGITGELFPETAPFARFVIALDPVSKADPPVYPHALDPQLLGELERCTGMPFRHAGRWS